MIKVAVLYIGIGQYINFWHDFYSSMERYFLPNSTKDYYIFTDAHNIDFQDNKNVNKIFQENLGWPGNTLYRFKMFSSIADELLAYDYVFFMNANIVCLQNILEDELLGTGEDLIVVQHPGFFHAQAYQFPYERRRKSLAFIPYTQGEIYAFGAINGGKSQAYIKMVMELSRRVDLDNEKGVVAIWHDESHLNRYIYEYDNIKVLSPQYAYPEDCPAEWNLQYNPKILLLDKKKYITLAANKVKQPNKLSIYLNNRNKKVRDKYWEIYYKYFKSKGKR